MSQMESPLPDAGPEVTSGISEESAQLIRLPVGTVIERGDLFRTEDGRYLGMDNLGRILGLRCLGETLKKASDQESGWFRRVNNISASTDV